MSEPSQTQPVEEQSPGDPLRSSRTSRSWVSLGALVVVLILLVVFIAQNTQQVEVSFLGWNGHPPLSVALLVAAIGGATLAIIVGTLRILQVRRRVRRSRSA
ncbi:MAG: lipopolysaccharide assembly protein LapA domain-containing protein [Nocardioides sp.]